MNVCMCLIVIGLQLTHPNIIHFLTDGGFSASDAETLGEHLQVTRPNIKTLKMDYHGNAVGLFYAVIDSWLQLSEPSWEKLAEALDKSDYPNISKRIRGEIIFML